MLDLDRQLVSHPRRLRRHRHAADQDPLRALKPRGVDVVVAHLRARPPWELKTTRGEFEGTPVYSVPPAAWISGIGLKEIAREHPFELVHAQHYGRGHSGHRSHAGGTGGRWSTRFYSLLGEEVERDQLGRGLLFRAYQAMERKVFRHAAAVIVHGEPAKKVVVEEKVFPTTG